VSSPGVTEVVVRVATEHDLARPEVGGPTGEYTPQLAAVMNRGTGVVLVAEIDGGIVGRITVDTAGRQGDISGFVVAEDWRRQGVGTLLMDAAEAQAKRRRCKRLRLTVAKDNTPAISLYVARGYRRSGEGMSAGLRTPDGRVVHTPEPVWAMVKPI
jgi:ribosomal protein S18 acetylase RimI-like enzyme